MRMRQERQKSIRDIRRTASFSTDLGSTIRVEVGPILDYNGHAVPDGTEVEFDLSYPDEDIKLAPVEPSELSEWDVAQQARLEEERQRDARFQPVEMADEVAVMYASKVVELAPVVELFSNPRHPYTHGLFESRPEPNTPKDQKLKTIEGTVPSPLQFPCGCKFHPRCRYVQTRCENEEPGLRQIAQRHQARCHFAEEIYY